MAMKTPSAANSRVSPVLTFFIRDAGDVGPKLLVSPQISAISLSQTTSTLGCLNSRSCIMRSARNCRGDGRR
jgi:hypothetical protein